MDFTIDYGTVSTSRGNLGETLYASVPGRAALLGEGEVVFYDSDMDKNHVMTEQVLKALDLCRGFQPMSVHVQRLSDAMAGLQGQQQAIRRVLENLATRGLLVTADACVQRMTRGARPVAAPCGPIFVRTADRPAQLKALLQSLADQHARHPLPSTVVVVDDSQLAAAAAENRQLVEHFTAQYPIACRLLGAEVWEGVPDLLAAAVQAPADLAGLLSRRSGGQRGRIGGGVGRNLIGLLGQGSRYFLLDDDFLFPLRRHPDARAGVAFKAPAWAPRTYTNRDAALAAGGEDWQDPFSAHLALCGQPLGTLFREHPEMRLTPEALRGWQPSTAGWLTADARVLFTLNGHRGNTGASGISWLYLLGKQVLAPLLADPAAFAELRGDPPVWWGTDQLQISKVGVFTPFAIDGSQPMPPTSPFGRGEDALFNALSVLMHADSVQADLPWAIGHCQESSRDRSALLREPERADVNHCFAELAHQAADEIQADGAWRRLLGFATRLEELAEASDARLTGFLREHQTYARSQIIARMQEALKSWPDAPEVWRRDVSGMIEANGRAIIERGAPVFSGWPSEASEADCRKAFRHEATVLVRGLRQWPAASAQAASLRHALGLPAVDAQPAHG